MLMGEHAVLNGARAICCAVNRRVTVTAEIQQERRIDISSALGEFRTSLDNPETDPSFAFVLQACSAMAEELPGGVKLLIESEMSTTLGLGSSAAVTVAACAALRALAGRDCAPPLLFDQALAVVRAVQGRASGADCAASALGGMVGYRMDPRELWRLEQACPISLVYSGYKRKTAEVVELVRARQAEFPEGFNKLYELVHETVSEALRAVEDGDWARLGMLIDFNHGLMESLGVCDPTLARIVHELRACEGVWGAKISGSGLGDCALALGIPHAAAALSGERVDVAIDESGVLVD
jgi:mevalonate kinase